MGVKRKKEKKAYKEYILKYSVKIRCRYCDLYSICPQRTDKEALEESGATTRCVRTPNRRAKSEIPTFKQYFRNRERYN